MFHKAQGPIMSQDAQGFCLRLSKQQIPSGVRKLSYELPASGSKSSADAASASHHLCLGGSLSDAAVFKSSMFT